MKKAKVMAGAMLSAGVGKAKGGKVRPAAKGGPAPKQERMNERQPAAKSKSTEARDKRLEGKPL